MLDTNTIDYIFNNKSWLGPKLKKLSKNHINWYITNVQQDEISKITDISKKRLINEILSQIGVRTVLSSTIILNIDTQKKFECFNRKIGMYEIRCDTFDRCIFKIRSKHNSNADENVADFSILYTAVKKKMDYLITDNTSDFKLLLQKMNLLIPNCLQLNKNSDLDYY
jgi:rRNA-processing protein FCF1